jgi:hypothetical protein
MTIHFHALPTDEVRPIQRGGLDANGQPAERSVSDGGGNPCRHCLLDIPAGKDMLILAWRPFSELQPYAECGPIFLCAEECERHADETEQPAYFSVREQVLLKGYTDQERIKYGTGQLVSPEHIRAVSEHILENQEVAFVDIRSATNNCFQARVHRA